jgi:hypothetical protein
MTGKGFLTISGITLLTPTVKALPAKKWGYSLKLDLALPLPLDSGNFSYLNESLKIEHFRKRLKDNVQDALQTKGPTHGFRRICRTLHFYRQLPSPP